MENRNEKMLSFLKTIDISKAKIKEKFQRSILRSIEGPDGKENTKSTALTFFKEMVSLAKENGYDINEKELFEFFKEKASAFFEEEFLGDDNSIGTLASLSVGLGIRASIAAGTWTPNIQKKESDESTKQNSMKSESEEEKQSVFRIGNIGEDVFKETINRNEQEHTNGFFNDYAEFLRTQDENPFSKISETNMEPLYIKGSSSHREGNITENLEYVSNDINLLHNKSFADDVSAYVDKEVNPLDYISEINLEGSEMDERSATVKKINNFLEQYEIVENDDVKSDNVKNDKENEKDPECPSLSTKCTKINSNS